VISDQSKQVLFVPGTDHPTLASASLKRTCTAESYFPSAAEAAFHLGNLPRLPRLPSLK
jgi:hypothetical protein